VIGRLRRLRLRLRDDAGVTLIEMIVVVAILGIVLGGVTTVFISGSRAELSVNNRFQAQEASRLALAALRRDMHVACTATVVGTTQVTLSIPIVDRSTSPPTAPVATTQCGTIATTMTKVVWVVCTSPTVSTKFALYRATVATCPSSGKLVADNLVNTPTGFVGFFKTPLVTAPATIAYGETQAVDVDIPVSLKQGTAGVVFDLKEHLALPNTVWAKVSSNPAPSCSVLVPCFDKPCNNTDPMTGNTLPCYPPLIS
jgi:prepilin-type N-terminal cleavage/methylation domain-containing protein